MNFEFSAKQVNLIKLWGWLIPALYFIFFVLGFPMTNVATGHTGVNVFFGRPLDIREAGVSFKMPFIDVVEISNQGITTELTDSENATHDLQVARININSQWTILAGGTLDMYKTFGDEKAIEEVLIKPGLMEVQKALSAKYDAYQLQQQAQAIAEEARQAMIDWLTKSLALRGLPMQLEVTSVLFPHVTYSDEFQKATTEQTKTEQSIGTFENNRTTEVTNANAAKEATIRKAKAEAYQIRTNADAETASVVAKAKVLKDNPSYLCYLVQTGWDGKLPEVAAVGANPLPFAEVCKK